jgi:hypothetical protein
MQQQWDSGCNDIGDDPAESADDDPGRALTHDTATHACAIPDHDHAKPRTGCDARGDGATDTVHTDDLATGRGNAARRRCHGNEHRMGNGGCSSSA